MIDLANESLMSLSQAAAALPRGRQGKKTNPSTLFRWISKGVQTPAGNVRLESDPARRTLADELGSVATLR